MLKKPITYTDFDGNTTEEVFYFNLTKSEIIELELSQLGGMGAWIQRIIELKDHAALLTGLKTIILRSVGERSEDGKRFLKSDEIQYNFEHHAAYDALFMELTSSEEAVVTFFKGIIPGDIQVDIPNTSKLTVAVPAPDIPPVNIPPAPLAPPPLPQN